MEICFCLSSSPDKQKSYSLRPLWFDRFDRLTALRLSKGSAHHPESIEGRLYGDFLNELAVRRYALGAMRFAITHLR